MDPITVITDPVETLKAQNAMMYDLLVGLRGKEHALDPLEPACPLLPNRRLVQLPWQEWPARPVEVSDYDPWTEGP